MRKRVLSRILSMVLAGVMAVGMVGCGNKETEKTSEPAKTESTTSESKVESAVSESKVEEKEPVNLVWWYPGNGEQKDTRAVNDYLNELLATYPGLEHVTVELHPVASSDYKTQIPLALASDEQIDIICSFYGYTLDNFINDDTIIPLDDLMALAPDITAELPEFLMDYGVFGGHQYMIPNYQEVDNKCFLVTPKEYIDKGYTTMEKFEKMALSTTPIEEKMELIKEYSLAVREGEGSDTLYAPGPGYLLSSYGGWLGNSESVKQQFRMWEGSTEVVFNPFTENFKKAAKISAEWYEEGLIHPDMVTEQAGVINEFMKNDVANIISAYHGLYSTDELEAYYAEAWGYEIETAYCTDHIYAGKSWAAGGQSITKSCENPEEAILFIQAMTTEKGKELYNTVVYGLEGVHWEWVDKDNEMIKTLEYDGTQATGTSYSAHNWLMGSKFNSWTNQGGDKEYDQIILKANAEAVASPIQGILLDFTNIQTELDQINAVYGEYKDTLIHGMAGADFDKVYAEFEQKVKTAGYDKVLAELQKQVDAYIASK